MSVNSTKITKSATLLPNSGSVVSDKGELAYNSSTDKFEAFVGSSSANLVTDSHTGNVTINGNETVTGTLSVSGLSTLTTLTSPAVTAGALTVNGNETVTGTLGVSGLTTLTSSLLTSSTANAFTVNGNETVTGTLGVSGLTTLTSSLLTSSTANALLVNGGETVTGTITLNGPALLSGTTDPSSVSTSANAGSLYLNSSNANVYRKTDSGNSTNWVALPTGTSVQSSIDDITNYAISASVASSALIVSLKTKALVDPTGGDKVQISFRSATATNGSYNVRDITSALAVTASNGSTLGTVSGQAQYVHVYAIDNAGTVELALAGTNVFDEGLFYNTTAEGGAGAADSAQVLYTTTARTSVPIKYLGRIKSTQTTAGVWASAPSEVSTTQSTIAQKACRSSVVMSTGNGEGSTNVSIRRFQTTVTNIGTAITLTQSSTLGDSFTINEPGVYSISYLETETSGGGAHIGVSLNSTQLTTGIQAITNADRIAYGFCQADNILANCSVTLPLNIGDVVRAHIENGGIAYSTVAANTRFTITKVSN